MKTGKAPQLIFCSERISLFPFVIMLESKMTDKLYKGLGCLVFENITQHGYESKIVLITVKVCKLYVQQKFTKLFILVQYFTRKLLLYRNKNNIESFC